MSFSSVCPKCGAANRFADKLEGSRIHCEHCAKPYVAVHRVDGAQALNDSAVAEELRKLRLLLHRMVVARFVWNVALVLLGAGLFFWFMHQQKDAGNVFKQLLKLGEQMEQNDGGGQMKQLQNMRQLGP